MYRTGHALALIGTLLFAMACADDDRPFAQATADPTSQDACESPPLHGFGFDRYGGWKGIERPASGRFRVESVDGVWWFITPDGHALFSNGPTGVDTGDIARGTGRSPYLDAITAKYGSTQAWAAHTADRFCSLGIRTLGGWMGAADLDRFAGKIAYAVNVDFYAAMPRIRGGPPALIARHDVFDPHAEELAHGVAAEDGLLVRCGRDPWCIGVYTENEVPYLPSLLDSGGHLDTYLSLTSGAPAKRAVQGFFADRYAGDIQAFNRTWDTHLTSFDDLQQLHSIGSCPATPGYDDDICYFNEPRARLDDRFAFEAHVAARIAQLAAEVLRSVNPAMLNLGPRLVVAPFAPVVLQALAGPVDVISLNNYDIEALANSLLGDTQRAKIAELNLLSFDPIERLRQVAAITGKPVLITEWFYRRVRPGVTAYPPFLPEVADGPAQAAAYSDYMNGLLALPFVVGEHWFQWQDQPVEGRPDGENQLIGIVDIGDELNQPLADAIARVNATIVELRLQLVADPHG